MRYCIDESMRLSPPVPTTLPREVSEGGAWIAGRFFPAGTDIGTPAFTLQTDSRYYQEPFKFVPERWDASIVGEEAVERATSAFAPFSLGPRACIGRKLAYMELTVALARTVWLYDMTYVGGGRDKRFPEDINLYAVDDHHTALGSREGPYVLFRLRDGVPRDAAHGAFISTHPNEAITTA